MADTTDPGAELEPVLKSLPSPRELSAMLQEGVNRHVAGERLIRSASTNPERVYPLTRWLQGMAENLDEWGRAFASAGALAREYAEEELIDAVGEQDGIPVASFTVPDAEGDVLLKRVTQNVRTFDAAAVIRIVAQDMVDSNAADAPEQGPEQSFDEYAEVYNAWLVEFVVASIESLLALGSDWAPTVLKLKAYAAEQARRGNDAVAARLGAAVQSTQKYKGTVIERKAPK